MDDSYLAAIGNKVQQDIANLPKGDSLYKKSIRRFIRNRAALAALTLLGIIIIFAFIGPYFSPYTYEEADWGAYGGAPPSSAHWWGVGINGRDIMVRTMYGARISLMIAMVASLVSVIIGVIYGAVAGYFGKSIDMIMMRFVDVMYALPYILFVILLVSLFGRNPIILFLGIGAIEWLSMARIVRGQTVVLRSKEFIDAVRVCGLTNIGIIFKHIVPNLTGPVIVYAVFTVPDVILVESFLSYLGLGIQEPLSSLGSMISEGVQYIETMWWIFVFPGMVLILLLLSLIFVGSGLRDAFDPRSN